MTRWIEDVMTRTYEHSRRIGIECNERFEVIDKDIRKIEEVTARKIGGISDRVDKTTDMVKDNHEKLKIDIFTQKKDFSEALKETDKNITMQIEDLRHQMTVFVS